MKIIIEQKQLLDHCINTQNIAEKKNSMSILLNVHLEAMGNSYRIQATDLEVSLVGEAEAQVLVPGQVAVNARHFFEIIRELSPGPVTLTKQDNNWLEIKQGKYQSNIVGVNPEEFPIFPTYKAEFFLEIESSVLSDMIDKTIYSVSTDETRHNLNGVYFEINPMTGYMMVATDGHRLSLVAKPTTAHLVNESGSNIVQGVIMPKKGLNEIKKILEFSSDKVKIKIEGSQFILTTSRTTLMIRLIEGRYPNYQQFIPQSSTSKLTVERESFVAAIKRVSLLANQKSKAIFLNITKDKMELSSNNPDMGDAKEEVDIQYSGQNIKIGFNAKYLTEILVNIKDQLVQLELSDQLSPGVLKSTNDPNYIGVVMPMRI